MEIDLSKLSALVGPSTLDVIAVHAPLDVHVAGGFTALMRMCKSSCSSMPKSGKHSTPKSDKKKAHKAGLSHRKLWEVQLPWVC